MGDVKGRESVNKENELQFITQVKQKAPLNMYPPFPHNESINLLMLYTRQLQ